MKFIIIIFCLLLASLTYSQHELEDKKGGSGPEEPSLNLAPLREIKVGAWYYAHQGYDTTLSCYCNNNECDEKVSEHGFAFQIDAIAMSHIFKEMEDDESPQNDRGSYREVTALDLLKAGVRVRLPRNANISKMLEYAYLGVGQFFYQVNELKLSGTAIQAEHHNYNYYYQHNYQSLTALIIEIDARTDNGIVDVYFKLKGSPITYGRNNLHKFEDDLIAHDYFPNQQISSFNGGGRQNRLNFTIGIDIARALSFEYEKLMHKDESEIEFYNGESGSIMFDRQYSAVAVNFHLNRVVKNLRPEVKVFFRYIFNERNQLHYKNKNNHLNDFDLSDVNGKQIQVGVGVRF